MGEAAWVLPGDFQPKEMFREHRAAREPGGGAMSEIQGIGRFAFHDGKLDDFKRLIKGWHARLLTSNRADEIGWTRGTGT